MSNFFVTHCDKDYLVYAERLFETLARFSKNKILFYTIGFKYESKFDNVIAIEVTDCDSVNKEDLTFLKARICQKSLEYGDNTYCYLDADCFCLENCDNIFKFAESLEDYPIIYRGIFDFMLRNGRGNPFRLGGLDLSLTLEAPLMNMLGVPLEKRGEYGQTGVILYNNLSANFINEWVNLCSNKDIINNWQKYASYHEESILNILLWCDGKNKKLPQVLVNIPYEKDGIAEPDIRLFDFVEQIRNPENAERRISTFCRIPSKDSINNLLFGHGKMSDEQYELLDLLLNKRKFVFIASHLSTSGEPAYNLYLINKLIKMGHEVLVIEWAMYSDQYVIHRNKIIELLGKNFISLGPLWQNEEASRSLQNAAKLEITEFAPDVVYLSAPPERFSARPMPIDFIEFIYNKDRKYLLVDTVHDSIFAIRDKQYWPDEMWLVSDWHRKQAKDLPCKIRLVEMEIEKRQRPNRKEALAKLNLSEDNFYVLQVGIISEWKNHAYSFDLARKLVNRKIKFLMAGNLCFYESLKLVKPDNVILLGEVENINDYYNACDLGILPSKRELNPLCLMEGLAADLPFFISDLEVFKPKYSQNPLVSFIEGDNLYQYLLKNSQPKDMSKFNNDFQFFTLDSFKEDNEIKFSFDRGAKVTISNNIPAEYFVQFIDQDAGSVAFQSKITNGMWTMCNIWYYVNWKITVTNTTTGKVVEHIFDPRGKKIRIISESPSLGDGISWASSPMRFSVKHNCSVDYFTPRPNLFLSNISNVRYLPYQDKDINDDYYASYYFVCDHDQNNKYLKKDWRKIGLHDLPNEILGLEYGEFKPTLNLPPNSKKKFEKYVCLATQSTAQNRYYNRKNGWSDIVEYLRGLGYKIVVVDKNRTFGAKGSFNTIPDCDYFAGDDSFDEIINLIRNSDFFMGLSSGLSHLAWALNKPIVQICGSVSKNYEFTNPYRVQKQSGCINCWNMSKFEPSNWLFCPSGLNFSCSKDVSFEIVKEKIDQLISDTK